MAAIFEGVPSAGSGPAFAGEVRFVPLASVSDASLVAASVAAALGVREIGGRPLSETLATALRDTEALLVIDNFEHVLAATELVSNLLEACPRLRILATSRTLLRIGGEHAFPVSPLSLSRETRDVSREQEDSTHVSRLASHVSDAVRLFAERAGAISPAFALTETTAPLVADICRRLDGLPLAIELAAARMTHLSLPVLRERLERRLPLLIGGGGGRPDRHRTLRDAISWSHDLLTASERALFRRLAVFADGCTLESAESVGPGAEHGAESRHEAPALLDSLGSLVDASLVLYQSGEGELPRYRMLETIREFAAEQLAASGEEEATHRAHAAFFLGFAEQRTTTPFLPYDERRLAELAAEEANLRAALVWLAAQSGATEFARLVAALGWYWWVRGHLHDGRAWLERALTEGNSTPAAVRARIATAFGLTVLMQGEHQVAGHWLRESLELSRGSGDPLLATQSLVGLGLVAAAEEDYDRAIAHYEDALALSASIEDSRAAMVLAGSALANLGVAARYQGRLAMAVTAHEAALAKQRDAGNVRGEALCLLDLGELARVQGDFVRALAHGRAALRLAWDHGELHPVVWAIKFVAGTAVLVDRAAAATRLLAAGERLSKQTGFGWWSPASRATFDQEVAAARTALGERTFAAAWEAGWALKLEQAVAEALALVEVSPEPPAGVLAPRALEVLRLLVAGKTDREIADALFISVRTVEGHVAKILAKFGVPTRTAAASAANAAGLVDPDVSAH